MPKILEKILRDKGEGMTLEQAKELYPDIREDVLEQIYSSEVQQNKKWAEFSDKIIEANNKIEQIEENIGEKVKEQLKGQLNEIILQVERGVKDIKEAIPNIEALEKKIQRIEVQIEAHEKKPHITEKEIQGDIQESISPIISKQKEIIGQLEEIEEKEKGFRGEIQEQINELPTRDELHPKEHDLKSHTDVEITGKELNEIPKEIEKIKKIATEREVPRIWGGGGLKIKVQGENDIDDRAILVAGRNIELTQSKGDITVAAIEKKSSLPSTGNQGRLIFLTTNLHLYLEQ